MHTSVKPKHMQNTHSTITLIAENDNYPHIHTGRMAKEQRKSHKMLILQSNENEFIIAVCNSIDEYHNHNIERKRPNTKVYILDDYNYINSQDKQIIVVRIAIYFGKQ